MVLVSAVVVYSTSLTGMFSAMVPLTSTNSLLEDVPHCLVTNSCLLHYKIVLWEKRSVRKVINTKFMNFSGFCGSNLIATALSLIALP